MYAMYLLTVRWWKQLKVITFECWYAAWQEYGVLLCIVLNELDDVTDLLERQSIVRSSSSVAMNTDC